MLIIGGGPAGVGVLVAAAAAGLLDRLLEGGMALAEQSATIGSGSLGRYAINSDSNADSFLKCMDERCLRFHPGFETEQITRSLLTLRGRSIPLPLAAAFLDRLGEYWTSFLSARRALMTRSKALCARQIDDGLWRTTFEHADGKRTYFVSRSLVLATGAEQVRNSGGAFDIDGLQGDFRGRSPVVPSQELLSPEGPALVRKHLGKKKKPSVVIVGGSHSAMACASILLNANSIVWDRNAITILYRRPMRATYASPAAATKDGYCDFSNDDICPMTGRVFPLAGFRADSRELFLQVRGIGARRVEDRIELMRLSSASQAVANAKLAEADMVVLATGYRPRGLPLFDARGEAITLFSHVERRPMVNAKAEVLDQRGEPVPGVYGLGLAAGHPLAGVFGERSFSGQANGLSLWHGQIGEQIARAVLGGACRQ